VANRRIDTQATKQIDDGALSAHPTLGIDESHGFRESRQFGSFGRRIDESRGLRPSRQFGPFGRLGDSRELIGCVQKFGSFAR
jgi:hypothetical protein